MRIKETLGAVFAQELKEGRATPADLMEALGLDRDELHARLATLEKKGLVTLGTSVRLTEKGRKEIRVVFIGGGFEIIHAGHLHTIAEARRLGDVLVAVVARDETIRKRKGREPISPEMERVNLLSSLRAVDAAILGGTGNIYDTLEKVRPDIVALGYDQYHTVEDVRRGARRRRLRISVVRLDTPAPSIKTTRLLQEI
jgi:cytidyltransferase-like protein